MPVKLNLENWIKTQLLAIEFKVDDLSNRILETSQGLVPVSQPYRAGPYRTEAEHKRLRVVQKPRRGSARSKHKPGTLKKSGKIIPAWNDGRRVHGGVRYHARYAYYVEKGLGPGNRTAIGYLAKALEAHRAEIESGDWLKG